MQGGATSNTGLSLNSTSLRQRHYLSHWRKNNYQQQHKGHSTNTTSIGQTQNTSHWRTTKNNSNIHFFVFL